MLVDATTRAAMLSFSTPLARELRRALSPGFLCCRNSDVTVVIRRKVVGIDLHIWRPEKFYNSVTLFAVRPIIIIIILGCPKTTAAPSSARRRGEEGCSEEPQLIHDQNVEVRDKELKIAGRLKYFLSPLMEITSDRKILDMVEHCHLEFTAVSYTHLTLPTSDLV